MDNASDALKMAFAILVFMIGISVLFTLISAIKQTSDTVLFYSDGTNFYTWESGTGKNCRTVQEKDIIANLYNNNPGVNIVIYKDGKRIFSSDALEDIPRIIQDELSDGNIYFEQVVEVNSPAQYLESGDGTRIRRRLGETSIQIVYIKQ